MLDLKERSITRNGRIWAKNMAENYPHVQESFENALDNIADYATYATVPNAIVYSSGASLSRYKGEIHKVNDHAINIATPTNVPWLLSEGVRVDVVIIVDAHPSMWQMLDGYTGPIVCPVTVDPGINKLPNPIYWMKLLMGDGQISDPHYGLWNMMVHGMFKGKLERGYLSDAGCVTNMAIQIVADWMVANKILSKRIILAGGDYAYWNDWARIADPLKSRPLEIDAMEWDGYSTNGRMVVYKKALFPIWLLIASIPFYSMSKGILHEIPEIELQNILDNKFPKPLDRDEVKARGDKFYKQFFDQWGDKVEEAK
jgi:hypothetical protein